MTALKEDSKTESKDLRCRRAACGCEVSAGEKYCSAECEGTDETPDISCRCGHAKCHGEID